MSAIRKGATMANIEFNKPFTMPREDLDNELQQLADKLGEEMQLNCEWSSDDCLDFRRSGAAGQINIGDEELALTIKLGMLLSPFRSTIEAEIKQFMDDRIY
jgi:putative polyhydroxyalkanoate system protein